MKNLIFLLSLISVSAIAQTCPSGDEAAISQKVGEKLSLILCGFEDHEFPGEQGQRAFSDFKIFAIAGTAKPALVFTGDEGDTHLVRATTTGMTLTEVWEVGDKSVSAISRELTCEGTTCKLKEPKCVAKVPKNPYPKALGDLEALMNKGKLKEEAEDLVDKVFAQALGGDKAANQFFTAARSPKGFDGANAEAWDEAHKRIELARKSKCL